MEEYFLAEHIINLAGDIADLRYENWKANDKIIALEKEKAALKEKQDILIDYIVQDKASTYRGNNCLDWLNSWDYDTFYNKLSIPKKRVEESLFKLAEELEKDKEDEE
jgi:hypothetical protein